METGVKAYYRSLYEAAAILNSAHTARKILQSIVENVAKAMGAKGCSLMLLTPDKKTLTRAAACGLSERYIGKGPLSADKSLSEALAGEAVSVLDAPEDDRVQYPKEARKEKIASILSVPMALRKEIVGVIRVYTAEPREFTKDDIYFVRAVANLGAIALENAKLYETLKKDYETFRREYFSSLGEERAW